MSAFIRFVFFLFSITVGMPVALAQTVGATFGEVIRLGGTPSDVVLDESRGRLYLVNSAANRVDVYSYEENRLLGSIPVGTLPFAAAMSMDNAFLYVTNNGSSTLSVIDLGIGIGSPNLTITLPARPEGVEVGLDGRVLISTQGSGTNNAQNVLMIFDRNQDALQQLRAVEFPPPPTTPVTLPQTILTRPQTIFRGKLVRTPDGRFIVGVNNINNAASTAIFVYEAISGVVLKSRQSGGQSTVLAMSPDGSRFMAGFTLYDTATLAVIGQFNNQNADFPFTQSFNTVTNVGGSAFSPDGQTLYGAYNAAPQTQPPTRPSASTLLISDPSNLSIKLGIKVPESIVAKMVMTSDGARAWALSESGMVYLPLSTLYDYPIIQPDRRTVFLAQDPCNRGIASGRVNIRNVGKGRLTFSVPATGVALVAAATSGLAPAAINLSMEPGLFNVQRQPGTNLYAGNNGAPFNLNITSPDAINIPPTIRVYMNFRQDDQRGIVFPVDTAPNNNAQGLNDLLLDERRNRLYVANSGFNRIEVFDTQRQRFLDPIPAGQFPRQMALGLDGDTLYVANAGGESIQLIDLNTGVTTGSIAFPTLPRSATGATVYAVEAMAMGLSGLQFIMNNGTQWKVVGGLAIPRPASAVVNNNTATQQVAIPGPRTMVASPDASSIVVLGGQGTAYLYDALADSFTTSRQLFSAPIQSYYGPLAAGARADINNPTLPKVSYLLTNGLVLNDSLTVIGGAERPGQTQVGPPAQPGQQPTVTVVSGGQRNIAAVAAIDENRFIRLTTPVRNALNSVTRDDPRTTLELVDLRTGGESLVGVAPENPRFTVLSTQRVNITPRQMVVDSRGNLYSLTLSGLSVIPLTPSGANTRPNIPNGTRAIVNAQDGSQNIRPGSFITITGVNLAAAATADQLPPPTVLGGSCVVFNDVAIPLLQTSPTQLSGQIPPEVRPGQNVVQVRSLATAQFSDPLVVTVTR